MNIDPSITDWILKSIIGILLALNAWWIKQALSKLSKIEQKVNDNQTEFAANKQSLEDFQTQSSKDATTVTSRLNEHSKKLNAHGKALVAIQTKLNLEPYEGQ